MIILHTPKFLKRKKEEFFDYIPILKAKI